MREKLSNITKWATRGILTAGIAATLNAYHNFEPPQTVENGTYTITESFNRTHSNEIRLIRNSESVQKAVDYILRLQPEGSYILTTPGEEDIVPMDVSHAALALTKTGHIREAENAINWLLSNMTIPGDLNEFLKPGFDSSVGNVSYAGSWWDHLDIDGKPNSTKTRGRKEETAFVLLTINAIEQENKNYTYEKVDGLTIYEYEKMMVNYLTASNDGKGSLVHNMIYPLSFTEEVARMYVGLESASQDFKKIGQLKDSAKTDIVAREALSMLKDGKTMKGMGYDNMAMAIWGLGSDSEIIQELISFKKTGMVIDGVGVLNWDWQEEINKDLLQRAKFKIQGRVIAPAQSLDYGIALTRAEHLNEALEIEKYWKDQQREDGSFPAIVIPPPFNMGFGEGNVYTAARFILFENYLTNALASSKYSLK